MSQVIYENKDFSITILSMRKMPPTGLKCPDCGETSAKAGYTKRGQRRYHCRICHKWWHQKRKRN